MDLKHLRQRLNQPSVTLGLVIVLQLSSRLDDRFPWISLPRMALWLWIWYNSLFRRKSSSEASESRKGFPWRPIAYVVAVVLLALVWAYFHPSDYWTKKTSPLPLQAIPAIGNPEVILGSDEMTIYQERGFLTGTVSYYTPEGLAIGMAHAVSELELGPLWIAVRNAAYFDRQSVQLIANDSSGIVLKLDHLADDQGQRVVIGGPADVIVGEVAQLYSVRGGSFPVRVLGYTLRKDVQYLVVQPLEKGHRIIRGMSGSPIVQNNKLIGCVALVPVFPDRVPNISLARLAADMYAASSSVTSP